MAVVAGVESSVQMHIDRGDDLEARDDKGFTPLMLAAIRDKAKICRILLAAGASHQSLNPSGRNALALALESGAVESATVLSCANKSQDRDGRDLDAPATYLSPQQSEVMVAEDAFDLSAWIPEVEADTHINDTSLLAAAAETDRVISAHDPVDTAEDWSDIDAFLPERSTPFLHIEDTEARARVRTLLLRALREGSVPEAAVELMAMNPDGTRNDETESLLRQIINDLGAETDERFEYQSADESFKVFTDPQETDDEVESLAGAMAFMDSVATHGNDPLRMYLRETQRISLLTAADEVALGKQIESGQRDVIGAISSAPFVVAEILRLGVDIRSGLVPAATVISGYSDTEVDDMAGTDIVDETDQIAASGAQGRATAEEEDDDELAPSKNLEDRKNEALRRIETISGQFHALGAAHEAVGYGAPAYLQAQQALCESLMGIRFTAPILEKLCAMLSTKVAEIETLERDFQQIVVANCGYPAELFATIFGIGRKNATGIKSPFLDISWLPMQAKADKPWSAGIALNTEAAYGIQRSMIDLQTSLVVPFNDLKEFNRRMHAGARCAASAKIKMIEANLRLVTSIAKRYWFSGIPLDDLIQEGNLGLMKAVDKFDYRRGFKFATMATWWIRQQVSRSVADDCRVVRLPVHAYETSQRILREVEVIENTTGSTPTIADIAARLDIPNRKVSAFLRASLEPMPITFIEEIGSIATESLVEYLLPDPSDSVQSRQLTESLNSWLNQLSESIAGRMEATVLRMRYGLGGSDEYTLEDIGNRFDRTRERIRQIEVKALRALKAAVVREQGDKTIEFRTKFSGELKGGLFAWDTVVRTAKQVQITALNTVLAENSTTQNELRNHLSGNTASLNVATSKPRGRMSHTRSNTPTARIDHIIEMARALGINVIDNRDQAIGSIWVDINEATDGLRRNLIRRLIDMGFTHWSGEGYWK